MYIIWNKIYVMVSSTDIDVFEFSAQYIGTIEAPFNYIYSRFVDGEKLSVICQGNMENADTFGRTDCRFEYDTITNNWIKVGIAY